MDTWIGSFLFQNLVGLVTYVSWDVIGLCRTTSWVNKNNTSLTNIFVIKSTSEEFVVSSVNRITALECNDVFIVRKRFTNFLWCTTREFTNWEVKTGNFSTHVVLASFSGNHQ